MYIVHRQGEPIVSAGDERIDAPSHRDAAIRSLLGEPGARLIVSGAGTIVRYHVDQLGRIVEQSRYSA